MSPYLQDQNVCTRTTLMWTPTHTLLEGYKWANGAAQAFTYREPLQYVLHRDDNTKDCLCTHQDVVDQYLEPTPC